MKNLIAVLVLFVLCSCEDRNYVGTPFETGSHFQYTIEKRGVCFGDPDSTPISLELEQWRASGGVESNGPLVAWSRDIARGEGCDDHRFSVIQGKLLFDIGEIPRSAAITRAELIFTLNEVPTDPVPDSVIDRNERGPSGGLIGSLDPRDCFVGANYFAVVGATESLTLGDLSEGPMLAYGSALDITSPGEGGISTSREIRTNVIIALRQFVVREQNSIGFVISPETTLDPGDPGNVTPAGFDQQYCSAYIRNITLEVDYSVPD
ncbi:MAG: hypothetical protein ACR2MT_11975 [Aurantibacter sp.]